MHSRNQAMRVLFWNTWLLRPRIWPGGPTFPGSAWLLAPAVPRRATMIGEVLAGRFDVCALAECFEPEDAERVLAAWASRNPAIARGPERGRFPRFTGSGLLTIVDDVNVRHCARCVFKAGRDLRDPDSFATKGALLVTLDLGPGQPNLDLFSTHLVSGGIQWPHPGADGGHLRRDRMAQVDELIAFIEAHHDPANAMLLVGDFNVPALDETGTDPSHEYSELVAKLGQLGFCDLWATRGVGHGPTGLFRRMADLRPDPGEPDRVVDQEMTAIAGERIDYAWLAQPSTGWGVDEVVVADRPRRWAFPRSLDAKRMGYLSDHLALSVDLHV